jgi:hypothetical protein
MSTNAKPIFDKKKRRSLLGLLLLLLRSKRNIFVALMVMALLASVTLAMPFSALMHIPGLASVLSFLGVDVDAMMGARSASSKYWNLMSMLFNRPSQGQMVANAKYGKDGAGDARGSSLDFVTGGQNLLALHDAANKNGKGGGNPGDVNDAAGADGSGSGADGNQGVPGQDLLEGSLNWQGGAGGDVGSINGGGLSGGSGMNAAPYVGGSMNNSGGSASSTDIHSYASNAASNAVNDRIPDTGGNSKNYSNPRAGQYSSFAWKHTASEGAGKTYALSGGKGAMSDLSETFTTTAMAYETGISNESRSSFAGATYDGNSVSANVLTTSISDGGGTDMPNTVNTTTMLEGATQIQTAATNCANAQSTLGVQIQNDEKTMQSDASAISGTPPSCCSGSVGSWDSNVNAAQSMCEKLNSENQQMASVCQSTQMTSTVDCSQYHSLYVDPCSKWKCWFTWILAALLIVAGVLLIAFGGSLLLVAAGVVVAAAGAVALVGAMLGASSIATAFVTGVAAIGAFFTGTTAASTEASTTASTIASDDSTTSSN